MIEIYRDTQNFSSHPDEYPYKLIQKMDGLVQLYADKAYNICALDNENPKQRNWLEKIQKYYNGEGTFFVYAYYGYAVEEMVNQELRARYSDPQKGYQVQLQVTRGSTRPDIVITDRYRNEVAWLDITSENSAGHIYNKDGSGWDTTSFVAELLYPAFNVSKLRKSDDIGIGVRARTLSVARQASIRQNHLKTHLISKLSAALHGLAQTYPVNKSLIASTIEEAFDCSFAEHRKHPAIKSMLIEYLEFFPDGYYSNIATVILKKYYKNDRQDLPSAMRFISDSYERELENKIEFEFFDDWDEDFLE